MTSQQDNSQPESDQQFVEPKPRINVPELPKYRKSGEPLWHEPPILDYSYFEHYLDLQAWAKDAGINLSYRTCFIDYHDECELLRRYDSSFGDINPITHEDAIFVERLWEEIKVDLKEAGDGHVLRMRPVGLMSDMSQIDHFREKMHLSSMLVFFIHDRSKTEERRR